MRIVSVLFRFLGAIIAAQVFSFLVGLSWFTFFGEVASLIAHISWANWLRMDIIRGMLFPVVLGIIWAIGVGLCWLVRGNKWIAALPILIFIYGIIVNIDALFLSHSPAIVAEIGEGSLYYIGAICTFVVILITHVVCVLGMFISDN